MRKAVRGAGAAEAADEDAAEDAAEELAVEDALCPQPASSAMLSVSTVITCSIFFIFTPFPFLCPSEVVFLRVLYYNDGKRNVATATERNHMEEILSLLAHTPLFAGLAPEQLLPLLTWLSPRRQRYAAGSVILLAGYEEREIGIVLTGGIEAERTTPTGEALPITRMGPGGVFGDVLAGSTTLSPVTVFATENCEVLFFSHRRLLAEDPAAPAGKTVLLKNLVASLGDKYFALSRRLDLLLTRRLRDRVLLFLSQCGAQEAAVTLPMTRAQLAAYLNCDRTALCRELSRMQQEGLLTVNRQTFALCQPPAPCR